jgi:hypothetical protein
MRQSSVKKSVKVRAGARFPQKICRFDACFDERARFSDGA